MARPRDRYQIISERKPGQIIAEDTGLDITVGQVAARQGRSAAQQKAMYRVLADRLHTETDLAPTDVIGAAPFTAPLNVSASPPPMLTTTNSSVAPASTSA
ncbi:tautomerase family protein [Rhodococcus wratislaviensis]|uniref:tautomerase family protein n=1 Tax=Rhodococcus wratislaviensis TaxID=44752 RepID=UPI00351413B6